MLRARPSNTNSSSSSSRSNNRGIHNLELRSRIPFKRSRKRRTNNNSTNNNNNSNNNNKLAFTIGGTVFLLLLVLFLLIPIGGSFLGYFSSVIDHSVSTAAAAINKKDRLLRKQNYLRDIRDHTGGTDTELDQIITTNDDGNDGSDGNDRLLPSNSIYRLALPTLNTNDRFISLSQFVGRVAIVINVACAWGKTAVTYEQIQLLLTAAAAIDDTNTNSNNNTTTTIPDNNNNYNNHHPLILAFPTNDFHQEPGSNDQITQTVSTLLTPQLYHHPNFILFPKSSLQTNPLYALLQKTTTHDLYSTNSKSYKVKHNFYKYVVGRDGVPVGFYGKKDDLVEVVGERVTEELRK